MDYPLATHGMMVVCPRKANRVIMGGLLASHRLLMGDSCANDAP